MDQRLVELYVQRGRLRERISVQRSQLTQELAPLGALVSVVYRARAIWHQTQSWIFAHPAITVAALVAFVVWRPRALFRVVGWGMSAWRNWDRVRALLAR
jgi:hypothetical protein